MYGAAIGASKRFFVVRASNDYVAPDSGMVPLNTVLIQARCIVHVSLFYSVCKH